MKKALLYALTLALALSLTACGQPKTEQPTPPAPSTSAPVDTSTPEPIATPEPIKDTTPEPETNEVKELSGTELIEYFQKVYDICQEIHTSTTSDGLFNGELEFLVGLVESDGYTLPSDYEAQYKAWRPETDFPADTQGQQVSNTQQVSDQQSKPAAEQTQNPSTSTQQSESQQTQKPSQSQSTQPSGGDRFDPYRGFGSYDAMIDEYCKRYPELSREEIMNRNPDPATSHIDQELADATRREGRLHGG
jgi:hypothetical protein